jgi:hypothetical protein
LSRDDAEGVLAHVDIASGSVFCDLERGTGKDIIMTATRLPRGSVFLVEDEVMIRMMVADMLETSLFSTSTSTAR